LKTGVSDSFKPLTSAKSTDFESSGMNTNDLVKMMWTTGLLESESWFESRKGEPRSALHWAECGFLTAILMGTKESREVALDRLNFAEKISENVLKILDPTISQLTKCKGKGMNPHDLLTLLKDSQISLMNVAVSAEVFLFRAGSHILQKDYPAGSIHFRNAWKQHRLCLDLQRAFSSLEDLLPASLKSQVSVSLSSDIKNLMHFQEGVFSLSLSMAPASLARLAKISGIEANKEKGLAMLYKCINTKTGVRVPASLMFVLFWLLVYIPEFAPGKEERFKEANALIRFGNHYYPRSIFFSWLESYMCTRQGKLDRALKLIKRAVSYLNEQGFERQSPRLLFEKGWILFLYQEWEQSLTCLLTISDDLPPSPFTQLLLAVTSCMVGSLDQAEIMFKDLCSQGLEKSSVEKWIGRRALRFLGRRWFQLFPYEIIYVTDFLGNMNYEWLEQVLSFLNDDCMPKAPNHEESENDSQDLDEYCVLLLLKGSILRYLGRLKESIRALEKVFKIQSSIMHEKWIVPHALYEIGMVYLKGRDWKSGSLQFAKAKTFKKFDFRRSLNFKLNAAIEFINQEENSEGRRRE
jgi:tetratricopeptide (TPR) repeat protein